MHDVCKYARCVRMSMRACNTVCTTYVCSDETKLCSCTTAQISFCEHPTQYIHNFNPINSTIICTVQKKSLHRKETFYFCRFFWETNKWNLSRYTTDTRSDRITWNVEGILIEGQNWSTRATLLSSRMLSRNKHFITKFNTVTCTEKSAKTVLCPDENLTFVVHQST